MNKYIIYISLFGYCYKFRSGFLENLNKISASIKFLKKIIS
jgi:hypothetical protein